MSAPFGPFTLVHGLAISLALHGALLVPFMKVFDPPEPRNDQLLVVELQGLISDTQAEQQALQQSKGAPEQTRQEEQDEQKTQTAAPDRPDEDLAPDGTRAAAPPPAPEQQQQDALAQEAAKPAEAQSGNPGLADVQGAQEQKQARRLEAPDQAEILKAYVRSLSKKMRENLVYPPAVRGAVREKTTTYVAFTVEADGNLRPGTLKVTRSSGNPACDAAALRTVEKNAPFDPPPRPMTVGAPVDYFPN